LSDCPVFKPRFLSSVLHDGDDTLDIFGTVIGLVVYLRISQCAVVSKRLQRVRADVEHPAHVLIVHPLTHFLFTVPMADGIHAADEAIELGDHRLEGLSFD